MFPVIFYGNISISAFSMAFVAMNRYVGIFHSHSMKNIFSWTKSCLMIFVMWAFSFGMMFLPWTKVIEVFIRVRTIVNFGWIVDTLSNFYIGYRILSVG